MQSQTLDQTNELNDLHQQAIEDFVHFHRNPELSGRELATTQYIAERVQALGLPLLPFSQPGIVTQVDSSVPDAPLIALRADMDALPVEESPTNTYVSGTPGISHGCGHDGHMAINLAVMAWAERNRETLPCSIRFIFQSSEEMIPSGAQRLVEEGVLAGVAHVFGLHLWQGLHKGEIGLTPGPMMASTDDFEIVLTGPGGHAALPHESSDVIVAASALILNLQTIASRDSNPLHPVVVTVGDLQAHGSYNVLPPEAKLRGTVRTLHNADRSRIERKLEAIVAATELTHGIRAEMEYIHGTPPLINHRESAEVLFSVVNRHVRTAQPRWIEPTMGGEDFSFYLQQTPGVFAFIGMGGPVSAAAHHTPKFQVDPESLKTGIELMTGIIKHYGEF